MVLLISLPWHRDWYLDHPLFFFISTSDLLPNILGYEFATRTRLLLKIPVPCQLMEMDYPCTIQKSNESHIRLEVLKGCFCLFLRPYGLSYESCRPLPSILFFSAYNKMERITKKWHLNRIIMYLRKNELGMWWCMCFFISNALNNMQEVQVRQKLSIMQNSSKYKWYFEICTTMVWEYLWFLLIIKLQKLLILWWWLVSIHNCNYANCQFETGKNQDVILASSQFKDTLNSVCEPFGTQVPLLPLVV